MGRALHTRNEKPSLAEVSLAEEVLASFVVFPRGEAGETLYLNWQKISPSIFLRSARFSITNIF